MDPTRHKEKLGPYTVLTHHLLNKIDRMCLRQEGINRPDPLTPITGNPEFNPGFESKNFPGSETGQVLRARDIERRGGSRFWFSSRANFLLERCPGSAG